MVVVSRIFSNKCKKYLYKDENARYEAKDHIGHFHRSIIIGNNTPYFFNISCRSF